MYNEYHVFTYESYRTDPCNEFGETALSVQNLVLVQSVDLILLYIYHDEASNQYRVTPRLIDFWSPRYVVSNFGSSFGDEFCLHLIRLRMLHVLPNRGDMTSRRIPTQSTYNL